MKIFYSVYLGFVVAVTLLASKGLADPNGEKTANIRQLSEPARSPKSPKMEGMKPAKNRKLGVVGKSGKMGKTKPIWPPP
jgi:hypothetical protein